MPKIDFLHSPFYIDSTVQTPRASTEFITEVGYIAYLKLFNHPAVADIGTGSANIAVSIALAVSTPTVYGVDKYPEAIAVAARNVKAHGIEDHVKILQGNLFEPLIHKPVDVIIANLPCGNDEQMVIYNAKSNKPDEPLNSVYGGKTGFELYRELFQQLEKYQFMDTVTGMWLFCCTHHLPQVQEYHKKQFPGFKLLTFKDKYKPYFMHCLFTKIDFSEPIGLEYYAS